MMAEHLHSTVEEAKARTSRAELKRWVKYWGVRPQVHDHLANGFALVCTTALAAQGIKSKHEDYLLKYGSLKPEPTPEELAQKFAQYFKLVEAHNGK